MRRAVAAASGTVAAIAVLITPAGAVTLAVAPGQVVTRDVRGFAPQAVVTRRLVGVAGVSVHRADPHGVLHLRYRVPQAPGRYRLLLSGRPAGADDRVVAPRGAPGGDAQVIDVVVPRTLVLDLVVGGGGDGVEGGTVHRGGGGDGVGRGSGPLAVAHTGSDLRTPLGLAVSALLAGALLLRLGRRSRSRAATGGEPAGGV